MLKIKMFFVVDDMIASGGSVLEVSEELRKRGAKKIYLIATFALFTEGIEKFKTAYENGLFNGLYTTNLSYIPKEYTSLEWFNAVDLSEMVATIIDKLDKRESLSSLFNGRKEIMDKIKKKR